MTNQPSASRSIIDVSAPVENYIVPVPAPDVGICAVCHGIVRGSWPTCYPCKDAPEVLGDLVLDVVAFVCLAPTREQMARDLYTYKRPTVPPDLRVPRAVTLAATLWRWLHQHERCMAKAAGLDSDKFDEITSVPSTSGREEPHPLRDVVGRIVQSTSERYTDQLQLNRHDLHPREHARDRFRALSRLDGKSVLIVDDTWTTGVKIQSASAALKRAGAQTVGGLAIGRWLKSDYQNTAEWVRNVQKKMKWSWDTCCLEP